MDQYRQQPPDERDAPERPPLGEPDYAPAGHHPADAPAHKQSGLGIASFVIGLVSVIAIVVALVAAASVVAQFTSPGGTIDQETIIAEAGPPLVISSLFLLLALGLAFVGLILGIIGLFVKYRRKAFGIIGVVLNALVLFGFFALLLFGLAMQGLA